MMDATLWLTRELLSSRLPPGAPIPEGARFLDLDRALGQAGGTLEPGGTSLPPAWTAYLCRLRIAGVEPLIATASLPAGSDRAAARTGALEIDVLTGGTLDGIRILQGRTGARAGEAAAPEAPPPPPTAPPWMRAERIDASRIHGALLGLAVGDCLGAPVENWPPEKIARVHGAFRDYVSGRGWGLGQPTRETTFALLVLREIAEGRGVDRHDDRARLAQTFHRWVLARPRDFGHLTRGILRSYRTGPPVVMARAAWERADRALEFNAALSRAAALGVALWADQDRRWASALAASAMTHVAPVCLASAVAIAEGCAAAIRANDPLEAARRAVWEERCSWALEEIDRGWEPGGKEWAGHERGHPLKSLQAAFWAARQTGSFEEVLLDLVHRGGDADTHAALAGCLLGAVRGPGEIPSRWTAPLEVRPVLENLAAKLAVREAQDA